MLMAPPMALLPYIDEAGPFTTSILSTEAGSSRFQFTEPPSDLFTGTPSIITRTLACSLPLSPRMVTLDLCEKMPNERLTLSPGTEASISSTVAAGLEAMAAGPRRLTRAGTSAILLVPRFAVTITSPASINSSSRAKLMFTVPPAVTSTLPDCDLYPRILASRVWLPTGTCSKMNVPLMPVVAPLISSRITATSRRGCPSRLPVTLPVIVPWLKATAEKARISIAESINREDFTLSSFTVFYF